MAFATHCIGELSMKIKMGVVFMIGWLVVLGLTAL